MQTPMVSKPANGTIEWDIDVPLGTNPLMFLTSIKVCLLSGLVMALLLSFIIGVEGDFDAILPLLVMCGWITLGLWVLFLFVMFVVFWNKMPMHFSLQKNKIVCEITSKTAKRANRLAIILGLLMRKPGVAGSGLLAYSQEVTEIDFKEINKAKYFPRLKSIILYNSWRQVLMIFCPDSMYEKVAESLKTTVEHNNKTRVVRTKNPLLNILFRTVLVAILMIPMFNMPYPLETDLFLSILILCFALATVWLIPLMGYVVIGGIVLQFFMTFASGIEMHESYYDFMENYRGFELINGDEWIGVALYALAGLLLIYGSIRAIKGKDESALLMQ
jgi:hypothetical protein